MKKIRSWSDYHLAKRENLKPTIEMESFLIEKTKKDKKEKDKATLELLSFLENTVTYTAKKYYWSNVENDDLISAGNEGIISAIESFDHTKNTKFTTFATYYIIGRIRRIVDLENNTIKKPSHINRTISKINSLKLENPEVSDLKILLDKKTSLNTLEMALKAKEQKLYDIDDYWDVEYEENEEFIDKILVDNLLEKLSELEKKAITLKFGLQNNDSHTYKQLDKILDKDSEIIVLRALKKLREILKEEEF